MSAKHPIIAITGSSGAGTTSVMRTFEQIFRREGVKAAFVEGDSFHRYDRAEMKRHMADGVSGKDDQFQPFRARGQSLRGTRGPVPHYGENGDRPLAQISARRQPRRRHSASRPAPSRRGRTCAADTDLLFYEGLHGAVAMARSTSSQYVDLRIGVVPVINLEWIQKLHRDKATRGYTTEAVTDTILRRMHDYVHYICPQFSRTHINFQRVPVVDTSNPFIARHVPTPTRACW